MKRAEYATTLQELFAVPVPAESRTYKPVSHRELSHLTDQAVKNIGFEVDKARFTCMNSGNIATGMYTIKGVEDEDMQLMIGWQNSYNKQVSLKFAIGSQVFICSNGCVSGSIGAFKRKHQGDVQIFTPQMIGSYIADSQKSFNLLVEEKELMKQATLTKRETGEMLGRLFVEQEVLNTLQLNIVKDELVKPTHNYKAPKTIWELYNYVTFALKGTPPRDYLYNHTRAHEFFMSYLRVTDTIVYEIETLNLIENGISQESTENFGPTSILTPPHWNGGNLYQEQEG